MRLSFSVEGTPRPKARARVTRNGCYTPKLTRDYENAVKLFAGIALGAARGWRTDGLFKVSATFTFAHNTLADLDNLLKSVTDAQAAEVFDNDRQVVETSALKHQGERDHTHVVVERLGDAPKRKRFRPGSASTFDELIAAEDKIRKERGQ
jgi:Holliday junction resolvase RusA-like endonuclease